MKIVTFDCSKAEDAEDGKRLIDTIRISKWMAGGPGGASWNATDLICFADIETSCEHGELWTALRVGERRVASATTAITRAGLQHVQLKAAERAWQAGLDVDKVAGRYQLRTAVFSLLTELSCTTPVEVAPGEAIFGDSADSSAFVAGFASGE